MTNILFISLPMIALTHVPSPNLQACERTFVPHEAIDYALAVRQHAAYCQLLGECGAEVVTLDANADMPDSTFTEDTAVVLDEVAILAPLGAPSRRAESAAIEPILSNYRPLTKLRLPATIDGGDVLRVGRKLIVGESCRTNAAGLAGLEAIARRYGYKINSLPVRGCLHLKTACSALPDGRLLVNPAWIDVSALAGYDLIEMPEDEPWGANVAVINGNVLIAAAHPRTAELIRELGFMVRPVDVSEFAKAEGGVSCLSLLIS